MRRTARAVESVLLLGGRSEIGLAIVERLVRDGARRIVLAARPGRQAPLAEAAARLRAQGAADVHVVDFDAATPADHAATVAEAVRLVGDLDVVVAAFGVLGDQSRLVGDPVAAAENVTVNLTGHVSAGLAVAARLREQGHGTLVVLSSVAGVRVRRANLVYGAAKAGLDGFAHALGDLLAESGARVLVVRPGYVRTRMSAHVPEAPLATTPQQVADTVAAALRRGTRTVWVPRALGVLALVFRLLPVPCGASCLVDRASRCLPGLCTVPPLPVRGCSPCFPERALPYSVFSSRSSCSQGLPSTDGTSSPNVTQVRQTSSGTLITRVCPFPVSGTYQDPP